MTPDSPVAEETTWDVDDVARYFKCHRSTVSRWVAADKIPYLRVGGWLLRFDPDAVKEWAANRKGGRVVRLRKRED